MKQFALVPTLAACLCSPAIAESELERLSPEFGFAAGVSGHPCPPTSEGVIDCLDGGTELPRASAGFLDRNKYSISGNASMGLRFSDGKIAPFSEMEIVFSFSTETDNGLTINANFPIASEVQFSESK